MLCTTLRHLRKSPKHSWRDTFSLSSRTLLPSRPVPTQAATAREKLLESRFDQFLAANLPAGDESDAETTNLEHLEIAEQDCSNGERFHWRRAAHMLRMELDRGEVVWDEKNKLFICSRATGERSLLQLPRLVTPSAPTSGQEWLQHITDAKGRTKLGNTLMCLLSADSAAVGIWEGDVLRMHKVFTGYTVRKQQGGSQLKYLRSGGPGRSTGGKLRVRETQTLFWGAAARLVSWKDSISGCSQAYMSGDVRCFNLLYDSDVDVPIARKDHRWQRAAMSIRRPRHKDFRKLFNSLSYGSIRVEV